MNWENTYQLPFLCTTETKLRVFQFKFLHRRVATINFLLKIGKKETDSCSFCAGSPETLTHLFWHYRSTQTFWYNVSQWTSEELDLTNLNITPFSPALCLGIIDNITNLLLHHFLLIARHYIYSCKLRNTIPRVQVYTQLVIRSMEIKKQMVSLGQKLKMPNRCQNRCQEHIRVVVRKKALQKTPNIGKMRRF